MEGCVGGGEVVSYSSISFCAKTFMECFSVQLLVLDQNYVDVDIDDVRFAYSL